MTHGRSKSTARQSETRKAQWRVAFSGGVPLWSIALARISHGDRIGFPCGSPVPSFVKGLAA